MVEIETKMKQFFKLNLVSFFILIVVLLVAAIVARYTMDNSRYSMRTYLVEFLLETENQADFAIYYDIGEGYNELDQQAIKLDIIGKPVKVQFCIPVFGQLKRLRFDPAMQYAKMILYSIEISSQGETFSVPLDTINPENQILKHEWDGTRYSFETIADANDSVFTLDKFDLISEISNLDKALYYGAWLLSGLLLFFCGSWMYRFFFLGM